MLTRRFHYTVDLPIQKYTEPVPLKYGKLAMHKIFVDIWIVFFTVYDLQPDCASRSRSDMLGWVKGHKLPVTHRVQ